MCLRARMCETVCQNKCLRVTASKSSGPGLTVFLDVVDNLLDQQRHTVAALPTGFQLLQGDAEHPGLAQGLTTWGRGHALPHLTAPPSVCSQGTETERW